MPTSLVAMRLALVAYIVPFFFLFEPGYLLEAPPAELIRLIVAAVAAGIGTLYLGPKSWLAATVVALATVLLVKLNRPGPEPKVE